MGGQRAGGAGAEDGDDAGLQAATTQRVLHRPRQVVHDDVAWVFGRIISVLTVILVAMQPANGEP